VTYHYLSYMYMYIEFDSCAYFPVMYRRNADNAFIDFTCAAIPVTCVCENRRQGNGVYNKGNSVRHCQRFFCILEACDFFGDASGAEAYFCEHCSCMSACFTFKLASWKSLVFS